MGSLDKTLLDQIIRLSPHHGKYDNVIDYYSAYEKLNPLKVLKKKK